MKITELERMPQDNSLIMIPLGTFFVYLDELCVRLTSSRNNKSGDYALYRRLCDDIVGQAPLDTVVQAVTITDITYRKNS